MKSPRLTDDLKYVCWVTGYKATVARQYGQCYNACSQLIKEFPELRLVRGWAHVDYDGLLQKEEHWWCEESNGDIVDPTDDQWLVPSRGIVVGYEEYDEATHGPEPTGKCHDCGDYTYDGNYFCSERCEKSYMNYLHTGVL